MSSIAGHIGINYATRKAVKIIDERDGKTEITARKCRKLCVLHSAMLEQMSLAKFGKRTEESVIIK